MIATVVPFVPGQAGAAELEQYFVVRRTVSAETRPGAPPPAYEAVVGRITAPPAAGRRVAHWVARAGGTIVGVAVVVSLDGENAGVAFADVAVLPQYRKQGIGTALLGAGARAVAADGRPVLMAEGVVAGSVGAAWARARGFVLAQSTVLQSLRLPRPAGLAATPPGYRLVEWVTRAPDHLVESYAWAKRAIADAPTGDLAIGFPDWTAARVREYEQSVGERGGEVRVVAAVDEHTGAVAGLTETERFDRSPAEVAQQDTVVLPAHRGRGLGLAMKARMVDWLMRERPEVEVIRTSTASDNSHMIRVNQALGFTIDYETHNYQTEVAVVVRASGR